MPELPEVESVRIGLDEWMRGAVVRGARVIDRRILGTTSKRAVPASAEALFVEGLIGATITSVERRGKFVWLPMAPPDSVSVGADSQPLNSDFLHGSALAVHLGMSGQFRVHDAADPMHAHTRAVLTVQRPDRAPFDVRFVDQRIFGHLGVEPLIPGRAQWGSDERRVVSASAALIAPDPFEPGFDVDASARAVAARKSAIKSVLLDQSVVSGIGNIYADEALFAARVHPLARADRLRISRVRAVLEAARGVMAAALEVGGTSFDALYVNVNGESGRYALNVYGREGHPCNRCGTPIVREKFRNRSSHFCPRCQRKR